MKISQSKNFLVANLFPPNHIPTKNSLLLQNNFLESRLRPKILIKFCLSTFFCFQFNFLENTFLPKISINIFWSKFFTDAKSFPQKQVPTKIFIKFHLVENFLWLQNHFLENRFIPKFSLKLFGSKIFLVGKSFPRKQVPTKKYQNILTETFQLQNHFFENRLLQKH